MTYNDPGSMGRQYAGAANLAARVAPHECLSARPVPWHRRVFDILDLPGDASILEVGCGLVAGGRR